MAVTELRFHEEEDGAIIQRHIFSRHELARAGNTIHFLSDGVSSSLAPGHGSREATVTFTEDGFVVAIGAKSRIVFRERQADEIETLEKLTDIANDELDVSAKTGDLEKVRHLLTRDHAPADITHDNYMAFNRACRDGQLEVVKYMLTSDELKVRADPTSGDSFSLRFACIGTTKNHFEIVKLLLTGGFPALDIHVLSEYPLIAACQHGNLETVIVLLTSPSISEHADPYSGIHGDAFQFAVNYHQHAVVDWLINSYGYIASPRIIVFLELRGHFETLAKLEARELAWSLGRRLTAKDDDPPPRKTKI